MNQIILSQLDEHLVLVSWSLVHFWMTEQLMALKSPAVKELGYCVLEGTIYLSLDFGNVSVVVSGWWYVSLLTVPSDSRDH